MRRIIIWILYGVACTACGVRGDPVPPKAAPEISRGQPAYKRATEDLAFPAVPPVYVPKGSEKTQEDEKK